MLTDHIRVHAYQLFKGFSSDLIKSNSIENIAVTIKNFHTLHLPLRRGVRSYAQCGCNVLEKF